jgi:hypothetical protein
VKKTKMKRDKIFAAVMTLSLAVIITIATVAPTLASNPNYTQIMACGNAGYVALQLPSNATPPGQPGTPNHPTTLIFWASDDSRRSTFGAADELIVLMWHPIDNRFTPVAVITDNPERAEFAKILWNGTYVWYDFYILPPNTRTNIAPNVIQVAPTELEVWTQDEALMVNLTKPVKIALPAYHMSTNPDKYSNQTFILPPMTLTFRATGNIFKDDTTLVLTGYTGASGYTVKIRAMAQPAWVRAVIPDWLGQYGLEFTGHTSTHNTYFLPS